MTEKRCGYCKAELTDGRAFEVCNRCGVSIWGVKMFNTILQNIEEANGKGDLEFNSCELPKKRG
jgi:uncharacterized protein with PIN domain